jgi:two-component system, LytTR family, response regulator
VSLRAVLVDDEAAARRLLRESCIRHGTLEVVGEFGDPAAALTAMSELRPDVVFLDIQMDGMSGLELARNLQGDSTPAVVFVTAYDQFALQAFEVSAVDYLLKPYDEARFDAVVARVHKRVGGFDSARGHEAEVAAALQQLDRALGASRAAPPRLLAEANARWHMLDVARIEAVQSDRNYVDLRVGADTFRARSTMQHAEHALQSESMLRISRSCLVNTRHIAEVSRTPRGDFIFVLRGGITLTSSEGFREAVRERLDGFKLRPA